MHAPREVSTAVMVEKRVHRLQNDDKKHVFQNLLSGTHYFTHCVYMRNTIAYLQMPPRVFMMRNLNQHCNTCRKEQLSHHTPPHSTFLCRAAWRAEHLLDYIWTFTVSHILAQSRSQWNQSASAFSVWWIKNACHFVCSHFVNLILRYHVVLKSTSRKESKEKGTSPRIEKNQTFKLRTLGFGEVFIHELQAKRTKRWDIWIFKFLNFCASICNMCVTYISWSVG